MPVPVARFPLERTGRKPTWDFLGGNRGYPNASEGGSLHEDEGEADGFGRLQA